MVSEGKINREVAAEFGITEGTVKSHVNGILQKMNVGSRTEASFMALEHGLLRDY